MSHRFVLRLLVATATLAFAFAWGRPALAVDRRIDAAAKHALLVAAKDHAAGDDEGGILKLQKTRKSCGGNRCSAATRAAVMRDLGALQFLKGDKQKAAASFAEALDISGDVTWNAVYDAKEVVAEWAAVRNERAAMHETPPEGDFEHVPESEQVVDTPLPVYAEISVPGVAKVVVKYKVPGDPEFKRKTLPKFGGGWGGLIPCADVKRGLIRYFLQAFDSEGAPIANSGDVRHLYFVPIRWGITGEPPHLPGQSPPDACNGKGQSEEESPEPSPGRESPEPVSNRFVRLWIGASVSLDLTTMSSAQDVCALTGALTPANGSFYCTTPYGADYPVRTPLPAPSSVPVAGKSGNTSGGITSGDVRALFTLDYAFSSNFLAGVRAGYVADGYTGAAASKDGKAISVPLHVEARTMYVFGSDPLAHAGFAPYLFGAVGYGMFDTSQTAQTQLSGVVGTRAVVVWKMGGPFFASTGLGARYAFSPRVAFLAGLRANLPFGSGGVLPSFGPETALQYGF